MRNFRQHELRQVQVLDGIWDFAYLGDVNIDLVAVDRIQYDDRMAVPGCFDATPKYAGKRGLTAYHRTLQVRQAGRQRLVFDSVHLWCRVYVNGINIGEHRTGFSRFALDFELENPGEVELVVLVDNRLDKSRSPLHLDYFDWYHYGGISRSIALHSLDDVWIEDVRIITQDHATRTVEVTVVFGGAQREDVPLTISVDGKVMSEARVRSSDGTRHTFTYQLTNAALWSPESPSLHWLRVEMGEDDWIDRFGIRTVRTGEQRVWINGKATRLLGFNRHEIHPQFGYALPDGILITDAQLLKQMGCNFVRGSHYPQDERFLDLCDELGLLVWNEAIGWQHTAEHLNDPDFIDEQKRNIQEMVAVGKNHPCVILWGILNESRSDDPACRAGYEILLGELRRLDPSRLLTYATCHPFEDLNYDLVDVISINRYPGWYEGEIDGIPAVLDRLAADVDERGWKEKPLIISEIGAGAVPGWHDMNRTRWSEEYQAALYDTVIEHLFVEMNRVSGLALWVFADFRSSESAGRILVRPRGYNNKGVVDEYRRPKQAFEVVRRWFSRLT